MGNNPNQVIQCGFTEKDVKKQVQTTKQYAIKSQRSANDQKFSPNTTELLSKPSSRKTQSIPSHENITKVSIVPLPSFVKVNSQNLYEEGDVGRCLDEIIQSRYNSSMHFPETQMIGLLEALVYSLAYLSKKNIPHHDFYPTNIFYKDGKFKLLNPLTLACSGYSITQQRKRFSFLSPQLILEVLNDTKEGSISREVMHKSDIFAIGMILLQFSTLQPSSECYDAQTYNIIDSVVQQRVNKCSKIYNPLLSQCIDLMLQYQVQKRIPPLQLSYAIHSTLSNYKPQTKNVPPPQNRMTMSGKIPPPQNYMVQTRLPNGQVVVGLPPGLVEGGPNIHMPQQPMHHHFTTQNHPVRQLKVEKMKLNPFDQIQEQNDIQFEKKEVIGEETRRDESLEQRVQRILEASRTLK